MTLYCFILPSTYFYYTDFSPKWKALVHDLDHVADIEYDGLVSEAVQFVATSLGMDEEMARYYGDSATFLKDIIDIPITGGVGLTGDSVKLVNSASTVMGFTGIAADTIGVSTDVIDLLE